MNARQIRAARAALGWRREDLAEAAGVHPKSVAYWEAPGRDGWHSRVGAIPAIQQAFLGEGIEFDGQMIRL